MAEERGAASYMEREMAAFFPNGIRALVVDGNARFLKSAAMLLSMLNFHVVTCGSLSSAMKLLTTGDEHKDINVVLADATKAAKCGFDFRGFVEPELRIPVIYFLSMDHRSAMGDQAAELLHALHQATTYIIRKPLDAGDMCVLWRIIAWRKCYLDERATRAADDRRSRPVPAAAEEEAVDGEERRHCRAISGVRGRKRKSSNNAAGSSGNTVEGAQPTQGQEMNLTERDDVASQRNNGGRKPKNGGNRSPFPQPVLQQTLHVPPCNPNIFAAVAGPSSTVAAVVTSATGTTPPPALPPAHHQQTVYSPLNFGPFPYQGPLPPVVLQDMFATPPAGALSTGVGVAGGAPSGASAPAPAATGLAVAAEDAVLMALMAELGIDNYANYSSASLLVPDNTVHGHGMASNANELTMAAGGAFGGAASSSMAPPHNLGVAPTGNHPDLGALGNINGSLDGYQVQVPAMGIAGDMAAMLASGRYEENTLFLLEELLGLEGSNGRETDAAAAADVAGTSLIGGEGDMGGQ